MRRPRAARRFAAVALLLAPAYLCSVLPIASLVLSSSPGGGFRSGALSARSLDMLENTVVLAAGSALAAFALGVPVGLALGVKQWKGRAYARAVLLVPLALPPYFHGIGWMQFFRPNGWAAQAISSVTGCAVSTPIASLQTTAGAIAIFGIAYFPLVALFTEKSLSLMPQSLAETAAVLGAGRWAAFRCVYWPWIGPPAASGAIVVGLLAVSDVGLPTITHTDVFSFQVLTQLSAFNDVGQATLLMLPLLVLGLFALVFAPAIAASETGVTPSDAFLPMPSRRSRRGIPAGIPVTVFLAFAALVPLLTIASNAADPDSWNAMLPLAAATFDVTALYVAAATLVSMTIALGFGILVRACGPWAARLVRVSLMIGFATPSAILGLSLLELYGGLPVSGSALVIAALIGRFQILAYYALATSLVQIPESVLETATLDGAGPMSRLIRIEIPMIHVPLLIAAMCLVVFTFADVGTIILLYPPGGETLMLALYSIEANSPSSYVAVLALLCAVLTLGPLAAAGIASRALSGSRRRSPLSGAR